MGSWKDGKSLKNEGKKSKRKTIDPEIKTTYNKVADKKRAIIVDETIKEKGKVISKTRLMANHDNEVVVLGMKGKEIIEVRTEKTEKPIDDPDQLIQWSKDEQDPVIQHHPNPGIDETENQFRYRVQDPARFSDMKTKYPGDDPSKGISFVIGHRDGSSETHVQAIRFNKAQGWTVGKVENWIQENQDEIKRMKQ
jgi:hypothetical protein